MPAKKTDLSEELEMAKEILRMAIKHCIKASELWLRCQQITPLKGMESNELLGGGGDVSEVKERYSINVMLPSESELNRLLAEYRTAWANLSNYIERHGGALTAEMGITEAASDGAEGVGV